MELRTNRTLVGRIHTISTVNFSVKQAHFSLLIEYTNKKGVENMYKNIEKEKKLCLADLVDYADGQVGSKTLVQNELVSMNIFSFDKGEEISSHSAGGDAMVTVLDGKGKFTVGGVEYVLEKGETLIMPKGIPHAVFGLERFKMQLTVSF